MQMIKVKYVGKGDAVVSEYDGIKYTFSKRNPIQAIPLYVYNNMMELNNPFRDDIMPVQDASEEVKEETKTTIKDQVEEIEKSLEESPQEVAPEVVQEPKNESTKRDTKRKSSRPRKSRKRSV